EVSRKTKTPRPWCKRRIRKAFEKKSIIEFGACILSQYRAYSLHILLTNTYAPCHQTHRRLRRDNLFAALLDPSKPQIFPIELVVVIAADNPALQRLSI